MRLGAQKMVYAWSMPMASPAASPSHHMHIPF
jgi:hypothetical protein